MLVWNDETEARWRKLTEEVMTGVKEWRLQHPKATFEEIEGAIDEGLARVRARMLEDVALASAAAEVSKGKGEERPSCPKCGHKMEAQGQRIRSVTTNHNQVVRLKRSYAKCPACGEALFPPG